MMDSTPRAMVTALARSLLQPRDIDCPNSVPTCSGCSSGYSCVATARTKTTCATATCVKDDDGASSSSSGINPGIIAGPVVAFVLLLALAIWWARRHRLRDLAELSRLEERAKRLQAAEAETLTLGTRSGSTRPAEAHSLHQRTRSAGGEGGSSPTFPSAQLLPIDELGHGQSRQIYTARSINLDPAHPSNQLVAAERAALRGGQLDPFSDAASAQDDQSFMSQSTNVIPIAYVPSSADPSPTSPSFTTIPNRPKRDPNVDLGMSRKAGPPSSFGLAKPPALPSQSGSISSASRMSVMSGAPSFMSSNSFALDAPTIAKVNIASAQRANIVQFGAPPSAQNSAPPRPAPPPPSSFPQMPASAHRAPPQPRRASNAKSTAGKSPLSNLAVSTFPSSPTGSAEGDPFNDTNQLISPPVTPERPTSRANTFGQPGSEQTGESPARSPGQDSVDDSGGSLYSLARPTRPYSTMSEQSQSSAVLQSATLVRIGGPQQQQQHASPPLPPPLPPSSNGIPRSNSANTLGQPMPPFFAGEEGAGDRSSAYTSASASSLLRDYTFTYPSSSTPPVPAAFPSSESSSTTTSLAYLSTSPLPPPQAATPPPPPSTHRETQYSLDSTFDFLPLSSSGRPDSAWGARVAKTPSEAVRDNDQEVVRGA